MPVTTPSTPPTRIPVTCGPGFRMPDPDHSPTERERYHCRNGQATTEVPVTGPEHFRRAEGAPKRRTGSSDRGKDKPISTAWAAVVQVHAAVAVPAATGGARVSERPVLGLKSAAWYLRRGGRS